MSAFWERLWQPMPGYAAEVVREKEPTRDVGAEVRETLKFEQRGDFAVICEEDSAPQTPRRGRGSASERKETASMRSDDPRVK